ncbi:MAG: NAD(P)/FAD-dependent oxidoreductase [Ruthenibacterium lactatiformans]
METNFDCIVIGAGPAGLSAALNLRQRGKTVLVVHSGETLLAKAEQVDNYLGMPGLSGKQMMERFTQHARDAGAVLRKGRAGNVMPFGGRFMVNLDGDILETGAVVLACGVSARPRARRGRAAGPRRFLLRHLRRHAVPRARGSGCGLSPEAPQEANFCTASAAPSPTSRAAGPTRWKRAWPSGPGAWRPWRAGPPWRPCAWAAPRCPYRAFLSCARPRRRTRWCPALRWKTAL